jgi:hypothetical protein
VHRFQGFASAAEAKKHLGLRERITCRATRGRFPFGAQMAGRLKVSEGFTQPIKTIHRTMR